MSRHAVERALWLLSTDRTSKEKFKVDPNKFLQRFQVTEEELENIISFNVKALQAQGVNPMLTMGFWQELSPSRSMRAYVEALRSNLDESTSVHSAALKGDG